ncbi:putative hydro-lyase [Acidovorax sp. GBBC 3334]|uniref:putative hydro-lyase n=1 Tax=Acidovorax sp. GBBC 3334 TaxID=2940496 RepID=UPI002303B9C1|nr:putative hydro-lyase [Acidovorax sp. GBBC 3334]MDA8455414.1 putative hydro-lyase [Acidovorax sp. GBBC 3334]
MTTISTPSLPTAAPLPGAGTAGLTAQSSGREVRAAARAGRLSGHTSGLAREHVQANLAILPRALAADFQRYCELNPRPCPVLAVSEPGACAMPALGDGIDLRIDVPRYAVWCDGVLVESPTDLSGWWQDDLVAFAIGCSFSFEHALLAEGIALRHVQEGRNVAMYRTNVQTARYGAFHGPMVVSMRPLSAADAERAAQITARTPRVHGAPVHMGDPARLGIADLSRPDYGDAVAVHPGEVPVFWACGVTPQAAIAAARLPFCITHAPGCMLVTDLLNRDLATA